MKPLAYKPAKTIAGAEKLLKSHGINTNYEGLAVEVANVTNKTVIETMDIAPKLRNTLRNSASIEYNAARVERDKATLLRLFEEDKRRAFSFASDEEIHRWALRDYYEFLSKRTLDDDVLAYSDPFKYGDLDYRGIYLNNILYSSKNILKTIQDRINDVRKGFAPKFCETLKSIIDHELGHEIDRAYDISQDVEINRMFRVWDNLESVEMKTRALSGYPASKKYAGPKNTYKRRKEFIADCWAEYRNSPNPRPTARAVGDRMMEIIKVVENNRHG